MFVVVMIDGSEIHHDAARRGTGMPAMMHNLRKKIFLPLLIIDVLLLHCADVFAGLVYGRIMGEFGDNGFFLVRINDSHQEQVFVSPERSYRVHLPPGSYDAVSADGRFRGVIMSYPQPYELNLYFYPAE